MKKLLLSLVAAILAGTVTASVPEVLPRPASVVVKKNMFRIPTDPLTFAVKGGDGLIPLLEEYGWRQAPSWSKADLRITAGTSADESYKLSVGKNRIEITSPGEAGAFYGIQTLRQLIDGASGGELAACEITDSPRFGYRGLHFDVSRNFRSPEFLKKQIDAMARLKLNRMHLHLTDGAGWRMEIDSFPRLTSYAAWRPQASWTDWVAGGAKYCDGPGQGAYGGYYTKDELRDIIDYAAKRHITVIPEIEMPGHSEEVIAAYPELGCNVGHPVSDFCPGKEATFDFLTGVLDEVIDVFPSHYIHIGGDEAGKAAWHECPDCRRRMEQEGLKSVEELQSYLIKRIEKYLNGKGRRMIGWDEILEGGVAPDATVMSWRGTAGGRQAMSEGHDVIMTPGEFCYLDYCQDAPFREPISIGGYTPLEKVYSYEPVEADMPAGEAAHLLGVQGNLWSEYVFEDSHAEHMYYPRAYAIAEIGWSPAGKDYDNFRARALRMNERMAADGYAVFDLASEYGERHESADTLSHLAIGCPVKYTTPYSDKYKAAGPSTLTDGLQGGWTYGDRRWQGWTTDMDLTVDLGSVKPIHYVGASFMHSEGAWVQLPEEVTYSVSTDGENFTPVATISNDMDATYPKIMMKTYGAPVNTEARYVRLQAKQNPRPGAWLFTDEIVVN